MSSLINQNWVFGQGAGLNLGTTTAFASAIATGEGCASISDANGNLLFYTDGGQVYDSFGTVKVPSGTPGLDGDNSSTQSAIIVPDPGSNSFYYVFTTDGFTGHDKPFNGIHLDVSTWISSPVSVLPSGLPSNNQFSSTEKLTAVQHANCVDYWVITIVQSDGNPKTPYATGIFRVFLVNSAGVHYMGPTPMNFSIHDVGYLKGSPNGLRLAVADRQAVYVYDFNNATGVIDNTSANILPISLPATWVSSNTNIGHPGQPYGVEFSPSGRFLYYSILGDRSGPLPTNDGYIFQVDLTNANPNSSQIQVVHYPDPGPPSYALGALQLGIDGRIYVAKDQEAGLGAIKAPDSLGLLCDWDPANVLLATGAPGALCRLGLPNLIPNPCGGCAEINADVDEYLEESCAKKKNQLAPCVGHPTPCTCGSGGPEGAKCKTADIPKLAPCISVSWGDSKCDGMETDDYEILCITVCNCYSNVTFCNFSIASVYVTTTTGTAVPTLPDGTLSVEVFPRGPICFGDIGPCKDDGSNCVSRQVVLIARGAKGGPYQLQIGGICFDVCLHYDQNACFQLELCSDR